MMTGTMTISIKPVEMMIRLRCWTAISPEGDSSTALHPVSRDRSPISNIPRNLGKDGMTIPRDETVGRSCNTTPDGAENPAHFHGGRPAGVARPPLAGLVLAARPDLGVP
jgi:hypothetical protein